MAMTLDDTAPRVLLVEDEIDLLEAMVTFLNLEGCLAEGVGDLASAERLMQTGRHEVVVLDLGLPDGDGLAWLAAQHDLKDKGVIITTARGENPQRLAGIRAGADAYLVKPVNLEELSSTIFNLTRRLRPSIEDAWQINRVTWEIRSPSGLSLKLTHSEAVIMLQTARAPGELVLRRDLVRALGQDPDLYDPRRMEILVRRLRSKVESALGVALPLETVHGLGYAFVASVKIV